MVFGYLDLSGELTLLLHGSLGPVLVVKNPVFHLFVDLLNLLHVGETTGPELQQGLEFVPPLVDLLQLVLQLDGLLLLRPEVVHVHPQVVHQAGPEIVQLDGEVISALVELVVGADEEIEDDLVLADSVGGEAILVSAWEADCVDVSQELLTEGERKTIFSSGVRNNDTTISTIFQLQC